MWQVAFNGTPVTVHPLFPIKRAYFFYPCLSDRCETHQIGINGAVAHFAGDTLSIIKERSAWAWGCSCRWEFINKIAACNARTAFAEILSPSATSILPKMVGRARVGLNKLRKLSPPLSINAISTSGGRGEHFVFPLQLRGLNSIFQDGGVRAIHRLPHFRWSFLAGNKLISD